MEIPFTPSPDVTVILNALLDKFENRAKRDRTIRESENTYHATLSTQHAQRSIKVSLIDFSLPTYFSQTDPEPRTIANQQLQTLEKYGHVKLDWLSGESGHLLQSITLKTEHIIPQQSGVDAPRNNELFQLLSRRPIADNRARLEDLLLAEKFRYQKSDWRARALGHILNQLRAGKSPSPFSLTVSDFNHDLLAVLQALSTLTAETPHRVFSVRVFNDTKRFDDLKPALIRLARRANPEWKLLNNEDLLRELNLVANPNYIHLSGNWELTDINGQIINLNAFTPSVGFPASQIESIQKITIRAESVLCIENLTSFHEFTRTSYTGTQVNKYTRKHTQPDELETWNVELETHPTPHATRIPPHATICLMGNPSPAVRHLLRLIPEQTPIYLWSDMDYGGFNILSQLRKKISRHIQPYLMDIATFESHARLSRPLTQSDARNLKRLIQNPILKDIHPTIEHLLQRGLKLEQEAIYTSTNSRTT